MPTKFDNGSINFEHKANVTPPSSSSETKIWVDDKGQVNKVSFNGKIEPLVPPQEIKVAKVEVNTNEDANEYILRIPSPNAKLQQLETAIKSLISSNEATVKTALEELQGNIDSWKQSQETANGIFDADLRDIEQKISDILIEIDTKATKEELDSRLNIISSDLLVLITNINNSLETKASTSYVNNLVDGVRGEIPTIISGSDNVTVDKVGKDYKISVDVPEITREIVKEVQQVGSGGVSRNWVEKYVDSAVEGISASGNYLPLTGGTLTGTLQMSGAGIQLDPDYTPPHQEGTLFYDTDSKALSYYNENSDVKINIGQESVVRVRNNTGSLISNGKVVCINGSSGSHPLIVLADNTSPTLSHSTLGMATHDISDNENGYVTTSGLVNGLNTSAFTAAGVTLWLDTSGNITETEPVAPLHKVKIGYLIRKHNTEGSILVAIDTGLDLKDIHDISIGDYEDGALLVADGALWTPGANINNYYTKSEVDSLSGAYVNITGDTMTGELVVNTTGVEPNIDFYDTRDSISVYDNANSLIGIYASTDLPRNAIFSGFRSRGTIDSPTAVQNGDTLLEIGGHGWNGTEIIYDGVYKIKVDGLVTTTSVPIEYTWSTDEYTEMMRLRNSGTLQLLANVPATNTTTGTLQVAGGGSFTGAVWVGTTLNNIQDCNLASDSSDRKVYVGAGNTSSGIIVGQSTVPSYNPANINYPDAAPTIFRITTTMNNSTGSAGRGSYYGYTNHTGNDENQPTYGGVFFANRTGSNVPTSDGNFAVGIHAAANRAGSTLTGDAIAVNAYARAVSTNAGTGEAIAVRGIAVATSTNVAKAIGVYGQATGAAQNYAGQFVGDVEVSNNVTILSLSGNTNQIVTLDANGKLLASGSTVPTSATFLSDYDNRYVNVSGDTMTGPLGIDDSIVYNTNANICISADNNFGWDDLLAELDVRGTGVNSPTWTTYRNGISGPTFSATTMQETWASFHVPHTYAPNTGVFFHIHFSPNNTSTGVVRWGFEYTYAKRDGTFGATSTVYKEINIDTNSQYKHFVAETDSSYLEGGLIEPDTLILIRIFRDAANAADTFTGSVHGFTADLHFQKSRFATKNKDPDFYT